MIHTSRQLKALVRNLSKGDSTKAQIIIRNYVMERFLERLSVSPYRGNLILKSGALVASIVGLDNRSTLDVDATFKNLPLSEESARKVVEDITGIQLGDGMAFEITSVAPIMDEAEYPGIRVTLNSTLETMRTPLKVDFPNGSGTIVRWRNVDAIERQTNMTYAVLTEWAGAFQNGYYDGSFSVVYNLEDGVVHRWSPVYSAGMGQAVSTSPQGNPAGRSGPAIGICHDCGTILYGSDSESRVFGLGAQ